MQSVLIGKTKDCETSAFLRSQSKALTTQVKKVKSVLQHHLPPGDPCRSEKVEEMERIEGLEDSKLPVPLSFLNAPQSTRILLLLAAPRSPKGFTRLMQREVQQGKH